MAAEDVAAARCDSLFFGSILGAPLTAAAIPLPRRATPADCSAVRSLRKRLQATFARARPCLLSLQLHGLNNESLLQRGEREQSRGAPNAASD